MKFLTTLLLTLCTFCGFDRLSADTTDMEKYLTTVWTSNEGCLFFNIHLANELRFDDEYSTFEIADGQGCEIVFRPIQNRTVFCDDGHELQEINLTVTLENTEDPNKVTFTTTGKSLHKGTNEQGLVVNYTYKYETTGVLTIRTVDVAEAPVFFTMDDEHHGVIMFRDAN